MVADEEKCINQINGNGISCLPSTSSFLSTSLFVSTLVVISFSLAYLFSLSFFTGRTALMFALDKGYIKAAEILLAKGLILDLQLDTRNRFGWTALMFAVDNSHVDFAKELISQGANIHMEDYSGMTALMIAINRGLTDIAKLLIAKGAYIDLREYLGVISSDTSTELITFVLATWHDTPLHTAVYQNDVQVITDIIKRNKEILYCEDSPTSKSELYKK